ncbi:MAG TPA: hypothetical protein VIJ40_08415 [Acidimicrobiales bacterium]
MDLDYTGSRYIVDPLLDLRTQLVDRDVDTTQESGWRLTYWPDCSEASLAIVTSGSKRRSGGEREAASDETLALHWTIANGRASSRSRRYFVKNQLRYMWVLTFAEEYRDRRLIMRLVSEFARRLRTLRDGVPFAYWYSPELHPQGHGWHVNFFVSFRVPHEVMTSTWGHGHVWVTDFAKALRGPHGEPLGICPTPRDGLRRAAQYGCKYSQKDWSPEHVGPQNHRYEIAQGFTPQSTGQWVENPREAESLVSNVVSTEDHSHLARWDSNDSTEWRRPPIVTWRW